MPKPEAPAPPPPRSQEDLGATMARRWPRLFGWLEHVNETPFEQAARIGRPVCTGHSTINPPPTHQKPEPPPTPPKAKQL